MTIPPLLPTRAALLFAAQLLITASLQAQERLTVLLRNETALCGVQAWSVEGTDLRLQVAGDSLTLLMPRDSIRSAWRVRAATEDDRVRGAARLGVIGAALPWAVAIFAPADNRTIFGEPNRNPRPIYLLTAFVISPITGAIGAVFGYQFASGDSVTRDEFLVPLGTPEDERSADELRIKICR